MSILERHLALTIMLATVVSAALPRTADATIVEFQTVMGNFEVNLYDNATPATVANFLDYVQNGAYTDSIFHRSVPGFIIQGGGIFYDALIPAGAIPLVEIPTSAPVTNEPEYSNVRGTIAMAKLGGDPNSATSQFFVNLANNSANLDGQNGGFTVFGEVVGDGMDVVDAIAALTRYDFGSPISELPLRDYVLNDPLDPLDATNLVIVTAILVSDSTVNSAAGLNPPANVANDNLGGDNGGGGGGGNFGLLSIFGLLLVRGIQRRGALFAFGSTRTINT